MVEEKRGSEEKSSGQVFGRRHPAAAAVAVAFGVAAVLVGHAILENHGLRSEKVAVAGDKQRLQGALTELTAKGSGTAEEYSGGYDECHGLLIGIAEAYRGSGYAPLKSPVRGVEAIRKKLLDNDPGHWAASIRLLTEVAADKKGIEDELARLEVDAGREDCVLLYFSGHGSQSFLVPAGTTGPDPGVDEGYLSETRIANFLDKCPAKHVLVVLDFINSGNLSFSRLASPSKGRPSSAQGPRLAEQFLRGRARQAIVSAGPDGAGGTSTFCSAFLDALTPKPVGPFSDFVHTDLLFAHILTKDWASTGSGRQMPGLIRRGFDRGSFVFFLPR